MPWSNPPRIVDLDVWPNRGLIGRIAPARGHGYIPTWKITTAPVSSAFTRTRHEHEEVFELDVPGSTAEQVVVEVDDGRLTVSAVRNGGAGVTVSEPLGFSPTGEPSARLVNGVLTVRIPRSARVVVPVSAG